eukprot:NODE_34_length_1806_cov_8.697564_g32_i0.p1 GENE.NODE_34_length_1806_cov_8.697564_g32_i0~~NODE_34_length_1806_cov_8.697564_g32_i0.p1  ORF type:complete len:443 (+),score=93.41 NODE_34_length_1806_cov_8.697564_g32_i0:252-1580(+)
MEMLATHSGLLCVGVLLESMNLKEKLDHLPDIHCVDPDFSHSDILYSMIGLMSIGKPCYDAVETFRDRQDFFVKALNISNCPSSPTIRQRIDLIGPKANDVIKEESASLVRAKAPAVTPIETSAGSFVPLDIDVSPFDNSKTKKEGVSRTYKGCDGYAPIFAYLGTEGYLTNLELREGRQHCQRNTPKFIKETLDYARRITDQPILMRLDSGNDSKDNFVSADREDVHFIIKRNLRRESPEAWADLAKRKAKECVCRPGKSEWVGRTRVSIKGEPLPFPIVFKVSERYIKKDQRLLLPEIKVETWWVSLDALSAEEVISLYHDHGTSEQFHSEIKTDMDLERLPSGRFESNDLILHLGLLTYNLIRIIGQKSLEFDKTHLPGPRLKKVKRRRIRTVMLDLIYMAGRLIHTGRRWFVSFGRLNPFADLLTRTYDDLRGSPVSP